MTYSRTRQGVSVTRPDVTPESRLHPACDDSSHPDHRTAGRRRLWARGSAAERTLCATVYLLRYLEAHAAHPDEGSGGICVPLVTRAPQTPSEGHRLRMIATTCTSYGRHCGNHDVVAREPEGQGPLAQ